MNRLDFLDPKRNRLAGLEPVSNRLADLEPEPNRLADLDAASRPSLMKRMAAAALSPLGKVADVVNRGVFARTAYESEMMPEWSGALEQTGATGPETISPLLGGSAFQAAYAGQIGTNEVMRQLEAGQEPNLARGLGHIAGRALGSAWRGLSGKEKDFSSDTWAELYGQPVGAAQKVARGVGGFMTDTALDPVSYLDFGTATTAGRIAKASGDIAPTAAGQAARGQRALVSFMGEPVVRGAKAFEPLSALAGAGRATAPGQWLSKAFRRGSTHQGLDRLLQLTGNRHVDLQGQGQKFAWELRDAAESMAATTGRNVDEVGRTLLEGVELAGRENGASLVEDLFERELPGMVEQAGSFTGKWQGRMGTEIGDMLTSGMKMGDLGPGYVPHLFTDEWHKLMGRLEKHPAFRAFSRTTGAMNPRELTSNYTVREFNDILSTQGIRGIIPDLPEELNFMVKKALHDDPAYVAATYLRGTARARTGQELVEGLKRMEGVLSPDDVAQGGEQLLDYATIRNVPGLEGWAAPAELADEASRIVGAIVDPRKAEGLVADFVHNVFDPAQNWWKAWTLAPFPAYHTRNVVGNMWNCFLAGVNDPTVFHDAARIEMKLWEPSSKFGHHFKAGAQRFLGNAPLDDIARKYGVASFDDLALAAHQRGVMGRGWMAAEVAHGTGVRGRAEKLIGRESELVRGGMTVGTIMENNARLGLFLDQTRKNIDMGLDLNHAYDSAALTVKKFLFDYSEEGMTEFERRYLKRIMPFYTWTRNNLPLQLEYLLKEPRKFGGIAKAEHAYQDMPWMGQRPDESYMPDWQQEGYPFRVLGNETTPSQYLSLETWLPAADIGKLSSPRAAGEMLMNLLTPLAKVPLEQGINYNAFYQRPIQNYNWERTQFLGQNMSPRLAHILRNLRPLSEINNWMKPDTPIGSKLGRLLTGKVYPYDPASAFDNREWEAETEDRDIEAAINRALDRGDTDEANRLMRIQAKLYTQ